MAAGPAGRLEPVRHRRARPRVAGLWATAATPLAGPVLDDVIVGIDEDANLVWAVERRLRGRDVATEPDPDPASPAHADTTGAPGLRLPAMTRVPRTGTRT